MGFFDWIFGGDKEERQMKVGTGARQMQPMSGMGMGGGMHMQYSGAAQGVTTAEDPVCGMYVDLETAAATSTYNGTTYYFCAPSCKQAFDNNPTMYLGDSSSMKGSMRESNQQGGCCC